MKEANTTVFIPTAAGLIDQGSEMHRPELYRPEGTARMVPTLDAIGSAEIAFYREHGYLAVAQAFTPAEVEAGLAGLLALIMGSRPDYKEIVFESKAKDILATLTPEQRQDAVRKIIRFVAFDDRLRALALHPKLLGAVQSLMGAEPHMFQDMGMLKPPLIGREKPWHQDHAYFNYPLGTPIVGVWVALDEATPDNGCMQILPGLHKEGPRVHFQRRDWQLCDDDMLGRRSVSVPLQPGGLLFFDGLLPHGTPHNNSPKRRRAVQFHFVPKTAHADAEAERLRVFGSEGKNVTC